MKKALLAAFCFFYSSVIFSQIIADHTVVDRYQDIPEFYINEIKKMWLVVAGESHSEAYRSGLLALAQTNAKFSVVVQDYGDPEPYSTSYLRASRGTWGDINNPSGWIYNYGEEDWCVYKPGYTFNPNAVSRTKDGISY